jgi:hypothetical protein
LADIDGDGDLDAFIGAIVGNTVFFRNTGSATAPAFATPALQPFGLAAVGGLAAPRFADLDADGDLDAVVGNTAGELIVFENTGSATAPAFAAGVKNPFGLADVGAFASPALADVDGDGDLDVFAGESTGQLVFFRNTGSATAPAFAGVTRSHDLAGGPRRRADAGDLDGDGDLDVVAGNDAGQLIFFRNDAVPSSGSRHRHQSVRLVGCRGRRRADVRRPRRRRRSRCSCLRALQPNPIFFLALTAPLRGVSPECSTFGVCAESIWTPRRRWG